VRSLNALCDGVDESQGELLIDFPRMTACLHQGPVLGRRTLSWSWRRRTPTGFRRRAHARSAIRPIKTRAPRNSMIVEL
jgi:hypothetical protein